MKKLEELLKSKGMRASELAVRLKCAPSTVCQWLAGTHYPRVEYLAEICRIFKVSADELLELDQGSPSLPKALAKDLYKMVTWEGQLSAQQIHQMASNIRAMNGGKISQLEAWLRNLAETVYQIELVRRKPPSAKSEVVQLKLLNGESAS